MMFNDFSLSSPYCFILLTKGFGSLKVDFTICSIGCGMVDVDFLTLILKLVPASQHVY